MKKISFAKILIVIISVSLFLTACSEKEPTTSQPSESKVETATVPRDNLYLNSVKGIIKDYQSNNVYYSDNFQEMPDGFVFPAEIEDLQFEDDGMGGVSASVHSVHGKTMMLIGIEDVLNEQTQEEVPQINYVFFSAY